MEMKSAEIWGRNEGDVVDEGGCLKIGWRKIDFFKAMKFGGFNDVDDAFDWAKRAIE